MPRADPNPPTRRSARASPATTRSCWVVFDPKITSYGALLKVFFETMTPDPGHAPGRRHRHAVSLGHLRLHRRPEGGGGKAAGVLRRGVEGRGFGPITTEILPAPVFLLCRDYYQQYLDKNPQGLLRARRHRRRLSDRHGRRGALTPLRRGPMFLDGRTPARRGAGRRTSRHRRGGRGGHHARPGARRTRPQDRAHRERRARMERGSRSRRGHARRTALRRSSPVCGCASSAARPAIGADGAEAGRHRFRAARLRAALGLAVRQAELQPITPPPRRSFSSARRTRRFSPPSRPRQAEAPSPLAATHEAVLFEFLAAGGWARVYRAELEQADVPVWLNTTVSDIRLSDDLTGVTRAQCCRATAPPPLTMAVRHVVARAFRSWLTASADSQIAGGINATIGSGAISPSIPSSRPSRRSSRSRPATGAPSPSATPASAAAVSPDLPAGESDAARRGAASSTLLTINSPGPAFDPASGRFDRWDETRLNLRRQTRRWRSPPRQAVRLHYLSTGFGPGPIPDSARHAVSPATTLRRPPHQARLAADRRGPRTISPIWKIWAGPSRRPGTAVIHRPAGRAGATAPKPPGASSHGQHAHGRRSAHVGLRWRGRVHHNLGRGGSRRWGHGRRSVGPGARRPALYRRLLATAVSNKRWRGDRRPEPGRAGRSRYRPGARDPQFVHDHAEGRWRRLRFCSRSRTSRRGRRARRRDAYDGARGQRILEPVGPVQDQRKAATLTACRSARRRLFDAVGAGGFALGDRPRPSRPDGGASRPGRSYRPDRRGVGDRHRGFRRGQAANGAGDDGVDIELAALTAAATIVAAGNGVRRVEAGLAEGVTGAPASATRTGASAAALPAASGSGALGPTRGELDVGGQRRRHASRLAKSVIPLAGTYRR